MPGNRSRTRGRLLLVGLGLLAAWAIMGVRLFQVQVLRAEELAARGLDQRLTTRTIAADRGTIYDRRRNQLAVSVEGTTVYADPAQVTQPVEAAEILGALLGVDRSEMLARLTKENSRFVFVARQLELEDAELIRQLEIPGISFYNEPRRVYPFGSVAAQVLGFVDVDNLGIEGIEFQYDELLSGTPGELVAETDPSGQIIPQAGMELRPAVPGTDLILAIDTSVQYMAEQACDRALNRTGAAGCTIVVEEVDTGAVLAMAVRPGFDPERRPDDRPELFVNRAVRSVYEPGSTQKLVTIAAALEEGVVSWSTTFEVPDEIEVVEGACGEVRDEIQGCYRDLVPHSTETLSVLDIVTRSSNVGTILVQQRLGDEAHRRYLDAFGLGFSTGFDYPGEAAGSGASGLDPTCSSCTAAAAIGYNVSVTPLQMAAIYSAVANDGEWMEPYLVEGFVDSHGVTHQVETGSRRVISEGTARTLRRLLQNVVESEEGTGGQARVPGYGVGGKTGTTDKYVPELGAYGDDVVASFVGMAPVDQPKLVVVVVLDAPQEGRFGGEVAAPVFAEVMERALHQLGVPPGD